VLNVLTPYCQQDHTIPANPDEHIAKIKRPVHSTIAMTTLIKPSALLPKGLKVQQINNFTLFKFTDELGDRMQILLDKKKADSLTSDETLELEAIGELDEIFSYINAVMVARANGHT
jgi:hypothetical protein